MDKSAEKQIRSSINSSEKKINNLSIHSPNSASKPSKKFVKYNTNHTYLNTIYLQSRDRYQKYVTNINNYEGLKFEGNKLYENLPVNKFTNDYILNTFNITKELENKILGYFSPLNKKETSRDKKFDGEKINLTPIPFKKAEYIHNKVEGKKIQEIKRSSVFMRRVEYTHLIQTFKQKSKDKKEKNINLVNKIAVLKGATLIIEDWWKKIKRKRTDAEIHNRINLHNFGINRNNNDVNKKINIMNINRESKDEKEKNQLMNNDSSQLLKSNKLNSESSISINSNNFEKINANIRSSKHSNNNSLEMIHKAFENKKDSEINDDEILNNSKTFRKMNNNNNYQKNILYDKDKKISTSNIYKKALTKKTKIKNNNKRVNILNSSTMIESIDKIKRGIFMDLNRNYPIKNKINNNKNNLAKKSTNDHTSLKNSMSIKDNNQDINNLNINNNLKKKYTTEIRYDLKDFEKINNPTNSYLALKKKQNKAKKANIKNSLELINKNNFDVNKNLNNENNENKKDNNLANDNSEYNYNIANNNIKPENLKNENNIINDTKISELNNNHKKNKKFNIKEIYIDLDENEKNNDNKNESENKIINDFNKNKEDKNKLNNDNLIKEKKKDSEENEKIKKIRYNRTNSFNKKYHNNNDYANKIIYKKREMKKHNNNLKSQEFSFSIKQDHMKRFENLKIISSNENLYINNCKSQIIENIENNFDLENISNQNYNSSNSKQNNIRNSNGKDFIESRNQLEENNIEVDDSEILPIEPDNQKNFILSEFLKQKSNKNENIILKFNNSKYKQNNNSLIKNNKMNNIDKNNINNNINNNIDSNKYNNIYSNINNKIIDNNNHININNNKNDFDFIKSAIDINLPKTVKNNNFRDSKNKNKDIEKNKNIYNSVQNNSIEIKGLLDYNDNDNNNDNDKYDSNKIIYIGGSSKNIQLPQLGNKRRFININRSMSVPKHIKEIHKLYKNKSAKIIKRKKDKRFEYIRSLHDKFEFEI